MLKKIAVLISGGGSNLLSLIDKVHNISGLIDIVISNNEQAYGLTRAKDNNIETKVINGEDFSNKVKEELLKRDIDLIVLAGFMKILPREFINTFEGKIINIHPSLIPSFCGKGYYGIKVHEAVLDYGVKLTGATVHFVDEGADTGQIILQESIKVSDSDTPESLQKKVLKLEHILLPAAVKLFLEDDLEIIGRKVINLKEKNND